ncbi:MAG TPA: NADH-quinone oxidoreductase subunit A [Deltaproteobacteria bacterium]|nr:NADH-quinone oxidoreductase subunit A [Deltaproteobacteria bacterium]
MLLSYLPVLFIVALAGMMAMGALAANAVLAPRNPYGAKLTPWECGMEPIGEADKGHFRIHFFIIAILFIIFDVETLFLFPWAVILNDASLAVFVFVEMFIFIFILAVGLVYAWVKGALEWV